MKRLLGLPTRLEEDHQRPAETGSGIGLVVLLLALFVVQAADAACVDFLGNRREFVGAPPDLFFTAGVKATLYIPQVYVNFKDGNESGVTTDCGAGAYSSVTGVTVQATYCPVGNCEIGQSAGVDVASSYPPSEPSEYREPSGIEYLQGPVPVIYDGTAPAGTSGTIDFAMNDEFGSKGKVLARVNVYIVSGEPPQTWFQVASAPSTISQDSLILDHTLLNGNPSARIFVMHQGADRPWNHPLAVTYDSTLGRWKIRNEDGTAMPTGLFFNVRIDPSALRVSTGWASKNFIIVDDPIANGNPYATLIATPVTSGTRRMNHPFGVSYVHPHWLIVTTDGLPMPTTNKRIRSTAGFFVKIFGASQYVDDSHNVDPSVIGIVARVPIELGGVTGHRAALPCCQGQRVRVYPLDLQLFFPDRFATPPRSATWAAFARLGGGSSSFTWGA